MLDTVGCFDKALQERDELRKNLASFQVAMKGNRESQKGRALFLEKPFASWHKQQNMEF